MTILKLTLALGVALCTVPVAAGNVNRGEEKLAKLLEGRVAGEPVRCISTMGRDNPQIIDRVALVQGRGATIYVARPSDPRVLDSRDILLIERFSSSQLCAHDHMRMVDRHNGFVTGVVFLDDFVPYTKAG